MPDDATGPIEYAYLINAADRLCVRYWHRRGVVTAFMVQLECDVDGRWVSARRYDTHGRGLHVHTAPWARGGADRRVPVAAARRAEAMTEAIRDIRMNRRQYRAVCEAVIRRNTR